MPGSAMSAILWLLLPLLAPVIAWVIIHRRSRANPNADIKAGVGELEAFRRSLASTNPDPKRESADHE